MKIRAIILLLCAPMVLTSRAPETPVFSTPIFLFKERNLVDALNIRATLSEKFPDLPSAQLDEWCNHLMTIITASAIFKATGRQVPEIAFDHTRLAAYSGTVRTPSMIVGAFSAKETLEETVKSLETNRVAHNFIIDTDGSIHQVKRESESDDEALTHRPFAVGVSGFVRDGYTEDHDINATAITISVVGKDYNPATPAQTQSMIDLIAHLSNKFSIKPTNILDYGCVALQHDPSKSLYGRRSTQPLLPWKELASHDLAIWPRPEDSIDVDPSTMNEEDITIWTSMALRKIGFLCPPTDNRQHSGLTSALQTFQKHFQCDDQAGTITDQTVRDLNSVLIQHEYWNPALKDIVPPRLAKTPAVSK